MTTVEQLYRKFKECSGVSTDTRHIRPDSMFFALKGPNFNANTFASEAIEKGARYAIVDEGEYLENERCLLVEDGLTALQELAHHHRLQLKIPVIAITGSNGKTTTKELIQAVLSTGYRTSATKGNLNNHIGVPLTLLEINDYTEISIVEMGANHVGEIAALCKIAAPTHGLITNIGRAHIEGFGGLEGIIRGKSELYDYLKRTEGVVFINSNDPLLKNMAKRFEKPYLYPQQGDYLEATLIKSDPFVHFTSDSEQVVTTHLIGDHNFQNIAAALCVAKFFNIPSEDARQAIEQYVPDNNRSQIIKTEDNTIILDAYNANPTSMAAAIKSLQTLNASHRTLILGDMLELGSESEASHAEIGGLTADSFDLVIYCGPQMKHAHSRNPNSRYFVNKEELHKFLRDHPIRESTILIKASRSLGLEDLVNLL